LPSNFRKPYLAGPEIVALPSHLPIGGAGLLPVNAYLLKSAEPVLIDTGMAIDRGHFEEAVFSHVDPGDLRWIVLTHDDRDHAGNLKEILMAAPRATLITNGLAVARLGEEWDAPANRVVTVNPGRVIELSGRRLSLIRPPSYDSPSTVAVFDHVSETLFPSDSFGSIVPELVEDARDLDHGDYLDGMALFTRANAPWTAVADERKFDRTLDTVRNLKPRRILSAHSPTAVSMTDSLVDLMRLVPRMAPWLPDEDVEVESVLARYERGGSSGH
jgi:flavorubredoxin